jgi:CBS domain-containing protein
VRIKDIMTPDPVTVPPGITVPALVRLLLHHRVSAVFVTDAGGAPLGVVSEGDLIRRIGPDPDADPGFLTRLFSDPERAAQRYVRMHGTHARDVMSTDLAALSEGDSPSQAVALMQRRRVRRLGVLRDGRLTGVVSRANLLLALDGDELAVPGDDERIREAILREMHRNSWGDEPFVTVMVRDGVARLEGYCMSMPGREALRVACERTPGVRQVLDRMEVHPLASASLLPRV